jgi:hypothetical protein
MKTPSEVLSECLQDIGLSKMPSVMNVQRQVAREMSNLGAFHEDVPVQTAIDWVIQTNAGGTKHTLFESHVGRGIIPNNAYTVETERGMTLGDLKSIYKRTQGIYAKRGVFLLRTDVKCIFLVRPRIFI